MLGCIVAAGLASATSEAATMAAATNPDVDRELALPVVVAASYAAQAEAAQGAAATDQESKASFAATQGGLVG